MASPRVPLPRPALLMAVLKRPLAAAAALAARQAAAIGLVVTRGRLALVLKLVRLLVGVI